ncbi:hypothetical protein [Streptomyces sp. AC1-42T]|uniref:hypothetical protein n=1 Tax=Streptomyces sp. AC1-42T TaxID=2218665 RepID=UPI000DAECB43|nr:hypothetical protein [Streptomyces sp. AC1-42T]PZT71449.1 hypothetical protein DNK55_32565 [Streptomyces sp. AC1-42T]
MSNDPASTVIPGPTGDAWDAARDRLEAWAESIDWEAYVRAEQEYLQWAYTALTEVTAHANGLSATELAALEEDRRAHPTHPGKTRFFNPRHVAARLVERRSESIVVATQENLQQLRTLGIVTRDVGLAVVAQGFLREPAMEEWLAGPWIRRGHPFPRPAYRLSWNDFPSQVGA